jgi:predicted pyridoxine 5'-phosphate oxidase superfamily flavin-nucleotide-binding protein
LKPTHDELTPVDRDFIESMEMFWLASSVDPKGSPTVSCKGGLPGFVKMPDDKTIQPVLPNRDQNKADTVGGLITMA